MVIRYITPKPLTVYKYIFALSISQNVTAHAQSTSTTHFSYSSKCRRTSLYKSYHRVFDFLNQKVRVRAITFAPPYMLYIKYKTPPTTLITYNISPNLTSTKKPHAFLRAVFNLFLLCFYKQTF